MRKEKAKPKESEAEGEAIQQPKPKKYPRQPKLTWEYVFASIVLIEAFYHY